MPYDDDALAFSDDSFWANPEIIYVSEEACEELQRLLAEPPREIPALRELYERHRGSRGEGDG